MKAWSGLRPATPELTDAPSTVPVQSGPANLRRRVTRLRRGLRRHRRLLAAACAGLGCMLAINALAPGRPPSVPVLAAARDLPAGTALHAADLRLVRLPPAAVPAGAFTAASAVIGHTTAGPLRRGEPLTDVRLSGGPLTPPAPDMVAAPVRLADPEAVALLQPGELVDVLAASTNPAGTGYADAAAVVASDVTVLAVPASPSPETTVLAPGALVVLATTPTQAQRLAQAQVSARLFAVVVN